MTVEELSRSENINHEVVEGFGDEWKKFDQSTVSEAEQYNLFERYFSIFPWASLSREAVGFDLGCGTGRWARFIAPRVGLLHCVEPSAAIEVARRNLNDFPNCRFHKAAVDSFPLEDCSSDFGYAIGVLHHLPDPELGLIACVEKLKPGAPMLIYLYYAFDNRPWWFRSIWWCTDRIRRSIACLPFGMRVAFAEISAILIYWPLATLALLLEKIGFDVKNLPLSAYRRRSFYTMRNDALDRFGTRLESRFTRFQIEQLMQRAGLEKIRFSEDWPYWCAVGVKCDRVRTGSF